ncbi:MAG: hypothetical protein ACREUX_16725 [Burkholderiales bacterium]
MALLGLGFAGLILSVRRAPIVSRD